jgi:hypothetical protein
MEGVILGTIRRYDIYLIPPFSFKAIYIKMYVCLSVCLSFFLQDEKLNINVGNTKKEILEINYRYFK